MKTRISKNNPFGFNAKGYLWERFSEFGPSKMHLDYGAHDGKMLQLLAHAGMIQQAVGVDLNSAVVERAANTLPANVKLFSVRKNAKLPFDDAHFYSVSMVGVLEHIYDQDHIIEELKRVTRPGGEILFAVPGKHLFSFLDMGNWKFVFPRVHRWFYILTHTDYEYVARYTANKDGMVGDIEVEKSWHQHFSQNELAALLQTHGLSVVDQDGFGFFNRLLINLRFFLPVGLKRLIDPLIRLDSQWFESSEIWVVVRKEE
jgi:SAM-dependent methyltransferase